MSARNPPARPALPSSPVSAERRGHPLPRRSSPAPSFLHWHPAEPVQPWSPPTGVPPAAPSPARTGRAPSGKLGRGSWVSRSTARVGIREGPPGLSGRRSVRWLRAVGTEKEIRGMGGGVRGGEGRRSPRAPARVFREPGISDFHPLSLLPRPLPAGKDPGKGGETEKSSRD